MAYALKLPKKFKQWKVKIRDREGGATARFMDTEPDPDDVPENLLSFVKADARWQELRDASDSMYPHNPIASEPEDDEDADE